MKGEVVNDNNFMIYAAKYYDNPQCYHEDEFYDDLKRFKYLKRLFSKYYETGELRERLILNHLIILYNLFGNNTTPMLFHKLKEYREALKPFLIFLNRMPDVVVITEEVIPSSEINMDDHVIKTLREIR